MADTPHEPERHINIHVEPEKMAGHYANFANVSHSDYEFTSAPGERLSFEVKPGETVASDRTYYYVVRAQGTCLSAVSTEVSATTPPIAT